MKLACNEIRRTEFELVKLLANNPNGKVTLEKNKDSSLWVIIKEITNCRQLSKKLAEHVRNERKILELLRDKNIKNVPYLLTCCREGDTLYMIMKYVPGKTLKELGMPFSDNLALNIMEQIFRILCNLHSFSIVYRDLKASNVIYDETKGHVTLIDFSLAKILPETLPCDVEPSRNCYDLYKKSRTNSFCGTLHAMAPEQIDEKCSRGGYSFPVDYWASGILWYEILVGVPPFGYCFSKDEIEEARIRKAITNEDPNMDRIRNAFFREQISILLDVRFGQKRQHLNIARIRNQNASKL
eukprot:GHVP01026747.1.p1 GENE.GHVP01026747.1~~GHVP01026747.1.p1  ORF type:complete len:298 (-),score=32.03 GHVP01026747.1:141-1034(-)